MAIDSSPTKPIPNFPVFYSAAKLHNHNRRYLLITSPDHLNSDTAAISSATATAAGVRLYDPYKDLDTPAMKLYRLPTSPEHLRPEKAPKPYRNWSNNLMYNTGICYLSGGVVGFGVGVARGLKDAEAGESTKLRLSRALNSGADVSKGFSNNMGIVGLYFSVIESGIDCYRGEEGVLNSCLAGFGAGAMYKAARGFRAMTVAGVIGGGGAVAAVVGKKAVKKYVGELGFWGF